MSEEDIKETENETVTALENLAAAETADKEAMANLALKNSKLTTELVSVNHKLVKALKRIEGMLKNPQKNETVPKKGPHYCLTCGSGVCHQGHKFWDKRDKHKD